MLSPNYLRFRGICSPNYRRFVGKSTYIGNYNSIHHLNDVIVIYILIILYNKFSQMRRGRGIGPHQEASTGEKQRFRHCMCLHDKTNEINCET